MGNNKVLDMIPFGRKNAISRENLCRATGMSDRAVREAISILRREHCILNNQDGNGYYRPFMQDEYYVEEFLKQESRRAKSIFWSLKGAKDWLGNKEEEFYD